MEQILWKDINDILMMRQVNKTEYMDFINRFITFRLSYSFMVHT